MLRCMRLGRVSVRRGCICIPLIYGVIRRRQVIRRLGWCVEGDVLRSIIALLYRRWNGISRRYRFRLKRNRLGYNIAFVRRVCGRVGDIGGRGRMGMEGWRSSIEDNMVFNQRMLAHVAAIIFLEGLRSLFRSASFLIRRREVGRKGGWWRMLRIEGWR